MKIGLDVHGVIDTYPKLFSKLSKEWIAKGWEVYILTGQEWKNAKKIVDDEMVKYTHHFSIIDYHKNLGTPMYTRSDKDGLWIDHKLWVRSKGDYASKVKLDIHFDDDSDYFKYFPRACTCILVPSKGFDEFYYNILSRR